MPAQYITVLNAVAPVIKAANPNVLAAGPTITTSPTGAQTAWASAVLSDSQAKANLDVFTAHMYCTGAAPEVGRTNAPALRFEPRITAFLTTLANAGFNKPFWITETGWTTASTNASTPAEQARYIVRGVVILRAYGVRVYQFEYGDSPGAGGYGLLGKPSYAAYATLNRIVGNGLISLTKVSHPTAWVYKYARAILPTGYILWTISGTANVVLTGLTATVRRTAISGDSQIIVSTSGGQLTVVAGIDPIYIENI